MYHDVAIVSVLHLHVQARLLPVLGPWQHAGLRAPHPTPTSPSVSSLPLPFLPSLPLRSPSSPSRKKYPLNPASGSGGALQ